MRLRLTETAASTSQPARKRGDYLAKGGILAAGLICLLLLAWGHLGLGAWLVPPAPTVAQQTAQAGPYSVALQLSSGQLKARGPNTLTLRLRDQAGHPVNGASLRVTPEMTTMPMAAPEATGQAQGTGQYLIHPLFGMAGDWRLDVTISAPGQPDARVSFPVGVRWS
ncbi:MAG TPA: FixH family protein [Ktedonobacterales bacterium]|nr:FixH family protein [Ktedonobacterales bacterium]